MKLLDGTEASPNHRLYPEKLRLAQLASNASKKQQHYPKPSLQDSTPLQQL